MVIETVGSQTADEELGAPVRWEPALSLGFLNLVVEAVETV